MKLLIRAIVIAALIVVGLAALPADAVLKHKQKIKLDIAHMMQR